MSESASSRGSLVTVGRGCATVSAGGSFAGLGRVLRRNVVRAIEDRHDQGDRVHTEQPPQLDRRLFALAPRGERARAGPSELDAGQVEVEAADLARGELALRDVGDSAGQIEHLVGESAPAARRVELVERVVDIPDRQPSGVGDAGPRPRHPRAAGGGPGALLAEHLDLLRDARFEAVSPARAEYVERGIGGEEERGLAELAPRDGGVEPGGGQRRVGPERRGPRARQREEQRVAGGRHPVLALCWNRRGEGEYHPCDEAEVVPE